MADISPPRVGRCLRPDGPLGARTTTWSQRDPAGQRSGRTSGGEGSMKPRLLRIAVWTAAVLAILSCTLVDRVLGRGLTASQAQATATEARAAVEATELAPPGEGPRRLGLAATAPPV